MWFYRNLFYFAFLLFLLFFFLFVPLKSLVPTVVIVKYIICRWYLYAICLSFAFSFLLSFYILIIICLAMEIVILFFIQERHLARVIDICSGDILVERIDHCGLLLLLSACIVILPMKSLELLWGFLETRWVNFVGSCLWESSLLDF